MDVQTLAAAIAVAKKINNTEEYVISTVSAWLAEHVDPDTGYVLDDTLTVQGAAADAKATGDALALKVAAADIDSTLTQSSKPAEAKAAGNKIKSLDSRVNDLHGLVDYGYDTDYTGTVAKGSGATAYKVALTRIGTLLRLNGYGDDLTLGVSDNSLKVQLNSVSEPVAAITLGNDLSTTLTLINGHKYRLRQHIISAGASNTAVIKPWFHKGGTTGVALKGTVSQDANGDWINDLEYSSTEYPNGVHLLADIPRADNTVVLDDVLLEYTLEDLTVSLAGRVEVIEAKLDYLALDEQIDLSGMEG